VPEGAVSMFIVLISGKVLSSTRPAVLVTLE